VGSADRELVEGAARREARACAALVERFTPIIRRRVARALQIHGTRRGRAVERSDVLDLAQEVFVVLLDRDARVLRSWEPGRGLSLDNFVGLVAEREARSIARSGRRSAWAERPTVYDDLSVHPAPHCPEGELASRDELARALGVLREQLTPTGYAMFEALFIEESSIEEVAARFATTANALYTFRSRLRRELASLRGEQVPLRATAGESP
jgi:DNA-directed RNA polymerase specialized sigma24 family protein